jgi:hypothetical protein
MGVVYAPVLDWLYWGNKEDGAWKQETGRQPLSLEKQDGGEVSTIVASRSHLSAETRAFIGQYPGAQIISTGSSLKFMLVAEGKAQIYPRFAPTMEWDTAAAQAVLNKNPPSGAAAGGCGPPGPGGGAGAPPRRGRRPPPPGARRPRRPPLPGPAVRGERAGGPAPALAGPTNGRTELPRHGRERARAAVSHGGPLRRRGRHLRPGGGGVLPSTASSC